MANIEIFQKELQRLNKNKEHDYILAKIKELEKKREELLIKLEKLQYL